MEFINFLLYNKTVITTQLFIGVNIMIGNVIQAKRKELGLTQAQLAERLGVTAPAVNRWEKNLSFPDATLLAPLARLLKTDLNELFSFYDSLSDEERKLIVNHASDLFWNHDREEALIYIENALHQNLSDGLLYKKMGDLLLSFHTYKRFADETIYLEKIAEYYEHAIALLPEQDDELLISLSEVYAGLGNQEKAELFWSKLPSTRFDKHWQHIDMLYLLKQYDDCISEMKTYLLRNVVELSRHLDSLRDALCLANENEMAKLADEKNKQLREIFELWAGFDMFSNMSNAFATLDSHSMAESIVHLCTTDASEKKISNCPLFDGASLGGKTNSHESLADIMFNFMGALSELELNNIKDNS